MRFLARTTSTLFVAALRPDSASRKILRGRKIAELVRGAVNLRTTNRHVHLRCPCRSPVVVGGFDDVVWGRTLALLFVQKEATMIRRSCETSVVCSVVSVWKKGANESARTAQEEGVI